MLSVNINKLLLRGTETWIHTVGRKASYFISSIFHLKFSVHILLICLLFGSSKTGWLAHMTLKAKRTRLSLRKQLD